MTNNNNKYIYTLEGQICFLLYNSEAEFSLPDNSLGKICISDLNQSIEKKMWALGPTGFAHVLSYKELGLEENSIENITVKAELRDNLTYSITTITSKCPLSDAQKEKLKIWIKGQYSDGFGEAFGQYPIMTIHNPNKYAKPEKYYAIFGQFWTPTTTFKWID